MANARVLSSLLVFLAIVGVGPSALGQESGPVATLELQVQDDHSEKGTLTFSNLKGLTRYEGICLPERARETRVYDELGDVQYEARDENGRRALSFLARGDSVSIDLARGAPTDADADHPLYAGDVNFCAPADSSVVVEVTLPEAHTLFFLSENGELSGRTGTARSDGPTHVFYSYEAPEDARKPLTLIEVPPFRVFAPTPLAARAQEIATLAVGPYRAALAEAGLDAPFDAIRVLYQPVTPLAWEAGHYNGHGYIGVKEETLNGDTTQGYPISSVRVLVHEAFHAASFAYGKGPVEDDLAWWLEGSAKHSERHVDAAMPNATRHCAKNAAEVRCWDFDDRIKRADLDTGYRSDFTFDADWEPSLPQSDDTRRFYYSYSEFLVGAWIERHGEAAYRRIWDDVLAAFDTGAGCPCPDGWLEALLDDEDLFRPWADVKQTMPDEFEANVKPFVKDEEALQRELEKHANPLPAPWWIAAAGLAIALAMRRRAG